MFRAPANLTLRYRFHSCGIENVTELDWWEEMEIELSPKNHSVASVHATGQDNSGASSSPPNTEAPDQNSGRIIARIGCLPCQHASARGIHDQFGTLWASWSVESGGKKIWFAG